MSVLKIDMECRPLNPEEKIKILIRFPHGLGDVVMFGVVLKHLRKYRPNWQVDVLCGRGKHTALIGLCHRVYHDQEPEPEGPYKATIQPGFFTNNTHQVGVPNSKIVNCLQEVFGIKYDAELGRYEVYISQPSLAGSRVIDYLFSIGCKPHQAQAVLIHSNGNSSPHLKNLADWQVKQFCETIIRAGRVPVILDWDHRSPLVDNKTIFCPAVDLGDIWGGFGSGDAETLAALIQQSEAFIGIDSGPGKVASATDTPSLICWTGHHPLQFHDPASNTEHLVPAHHWDNEPINRNRHMLEYFIDAYRSRRYENSQHGLALEVNRWLCERLGVPMEYPPIKFVLPSGIGDIVWALHKIKAIAEREYPGKPIDVIVHGRADDEIQCRSVPFLKRFPFINSIQVEDVNVLQNQFNMTDQLGRYRYKADGLIGYHHYLIPNTVLERGERLETWLPEYPMDWNVINEMSFANTERGTKQGKDLGKFVAFYLGPETGNTAEGHNKDMVWTPQDWVALGRWFTSKGFEVCIIGAPYDMSFWNHYVKNLVHNAGMEWTNLIGKFEIGETFALLKEAASLISYQCGLHIVASYLGIPTMSWWRKDSDSCHPHRLVSFDERMKDAWVNPAMKDKTVGLIYGKESVEDIITIIKDKGWMT